MSEGNESVDEIEDEELEEAEQDEELEEAENDRRKRARGEEHGIGAVSAGAIDEVQVPGGASSGTDALLAQVPASRVDPTLTHGFDADGIAGSYEEDGCDSCDEDGGEETPLVQNLADDNGAASQPRSLLRPLVPTVQNSSRALLSSLSLQFEHLSISLSQLPKRVAAALPRAIEQHASDARARADAARAGPDLASRLNICTTPAEICLLRGIRFHVDRAEGLLICDDCHVHRITRGASDKAPGVFQIEGVDFALLKAHVKRHVAGSLHADAVRKAAKLLEVQCRNRTAGRNCARLALGVVIEHQSFLAYERAVATAHVQGVDVGTLNHSAAFVRSFVHSMHAAIIDGIQHLLTMPDPATGKLPAFALVADKATCGRQTGQMVGLILVINGVKIALMLCIEVVRAALVEGVATTLAVGSGRNLALQLVDSLVGGGPLKLAKSSVQEQLTCVGFDGQYVGPEQGNSSGLDVGGWICKLLDLNQSWMKATWDRAHMLELAASDARKLPSLLWWLELHTWISGVQSKYLYGKGYDRLFLAAIGEMRKLGREDLQQAQQNLTAAGSNADAAGSIAGAPSSSADAAGSTDSELPGFLGGDAQFEVETILAQRAARGGGQEYLVRWLGWGSEHDSWVKQVDIHESIVDAFHQQAVDNIISGSGTRSTARTMPASAARTRSAANPATPANEPANSASDAHAGISARVRGQWGRLAALYHFCETRMAQSERKVYKNFLRNLHLFVSDMAEQRADPNDVNKACSLVTVVRLMGAIDILRHIKDESLAQQRVNSLVWEVDKNTRAFIELLRLLAADLRSGDVSRILSPKTPALEFLASNMSRLRLRKLQLIPEHKPVVLALPSELRLPRVFRITFPAVPGESTVAETSRAIAFALGGVAEMAERIAANFELRLQKNQMSDQIAAMAGCLNLQLMASSGIEGDAYRASASTHLRKLARWARPSTATPGTPVLSLPPTAAHQRGIVLPADEVLVRECEALSSALRAVSGQQLYRDRWSCASSSTVLMRDVFSQPKFYECCPGYLYLFQHCALKGVPEAIVEGMGGVWDRCAAPGRHLSFEAGVREAVVCWNAPRPYDEACDAFLDRALSHHFKGAMPHFTHASDAVTPQSKVVQKLRNTQPRLPALLWTVH